MATLWRRSTGRAQQGTDFPRQRPPGLPGMVRDVVEEVNRDLAGSSEEVILEALHTRLRAALPGVTVDEHTLGKYAGDIHRRRWE